MLRSASASSLVRCGCQYYHSSDPLPERRSHIGAVSSPHHQHQHQHDDFPHHQHDVLHHHQHQQQQDVQHHQQQREQETSRHQQEAPLHRHQQPQQQQEKRHMGDHEYEPIQAPAEASQPEVGVEPQKDARAEPGEKEEARRLEEEERYEVVSPPPEESPPAKKPARRFIKIPNTEAIIVPLHGSSDEELNPDRYLDPGLVGMGDLEAPLHRVPASSAPPAITVDAPQATSDQQTTGIQDRIRSQADKLSSKLKNIKKPTISFPKRPMRMPQAPTIDLPERPKIKLPDRPKFRLPERPKFHLPERPKFQLPERPKFHLPEKPKFLTERPKFKFPDRPKFGKEKKTVVKGKKPNPSSLRRPLRDKVTISSQSGSSPNIFQTFKFRTYPRFFKKKKIREERMSFDTESSLPSTPPRASRSLNTPWVESDIKYVDEENEDRIADDERDDERIEDVREFEKEQNTYLHRYIPLKIKAEERPLKSTKAESISSEISEKGSSGSSSNRRRAGVIEEIDSDEFFLREKGLSREDVQVSRFLSLEIRDAFRQTKNALASLDGDLNNEDMPEIRFGEIPKPPERKKSIKSISSEKERGDPEFHTFPKRPSRRKQSDPEKPPRRFRSRSGGRYGERERQSSMPSLNTGTREVENECGPQAPERRKSDRSLNREEQVTDLDEDLVLTRIAAQNSCEILPVAPLRKSRSRGTSLADDDRTSRGADSTILPDDDDLSATMEADKEEVKEVEKIEVEQKIEEQVQEKEEREKSVDISGYAVVAKDKKKQPPPRPAQPPRTHFQNQLENIKSHGKNIFFTYPRRAIKSLNKPPIRPVRNYSTLGPLRPPRRRRNRVARTNGYVEGETEIIIVENDKERNLKSGEVVMRMKGRPLPPPPRPPRKSKDYDYLPDNETETIHVLLLNGEAEHEEESIPIEEHKSSNLKSKRSDFFGIKKSAESSKKEEVKQEIIQTHVESHTTAQQTSFDINEVSVSIQTDPLPQDVILVDSQSEIEEGSIKTEIDNRLGEGKDSTHVDKKKIKNTEISEQPIHQETAVKEAKENEKEQTDSNIFQHALKRVEAARGVLQEAREQVTPSSLTSRSDERRSEHQGSSFVRVPQRDALLASARSEEIEKEGTPPPLPVRPAYTRPVPVSFPDKLHLSELDVDKLNVSELQANKITVSEIEGGSLQMQEINSRGGNLTIGGIELPPDFISTLVSQMTSQVSSQVNPQLSSRDLHPRSRESTPQRHIRSVLTPPPSIIVQATAEPVSMPEPEVPEAGIRESIPRPRTTKSKGRRTPTRVIDDSEDELACIMPAKRDEERKKSEERSARSSPSLPRSSPCLPVYRSSPSLPISRSPHCLPGSRSSPTLSQASSSQLMRRLANIWHENVVEGTGALVQGVNALFPEGEKRRDAQIAAVILLILVAGLILIGFGFDNTVHHHHWDYVPPR